MLCTENIVAVAKRENNTKRAYLVVNRIQGKHIPVTPSEAFGMFQALGKKVKDSYKGQPLLLVGFAETATAIGAAIAAELDAYYIQTTRECIPGVEYLYFSESHSHATEQKLVKDGLDQIIGKVSRIVFIEDEVTTGNTILNIIRLIRCNYGEQMDFSVASILNGMDQGAQEIYKKESIETLYLVKTNHSGYTEIASRFAGDGIYHKKDGTVSGRKSKVIFGQEGKIVFDPLSGEYGKEGIKEIKITGARNARRLVKGSDYQESCQQLWEKVWKSDLFDCGRAWFEKGQSILVLGTEEFMYPPLYVAEKLQALGYQVKCHATTRSPIAVSMEDDYPLHERYELTSLYDVGRTTYIYDLAGYDLVLVITDAPSQNRKGDCAGLISLQKALCSCGNQNIYCVRWCEK